MVLTVFLLGSIVANVSAQQGTGGTDPSKEPEQRRESDGTVIVNTDIITIMANPEQPMFHFWFTADENGTLAKFMMNYLSILEFEDANEDDAYQFDEVLHFAPLAAYEWTLQTGSVEDEGVTTEVWLRYTKGGIRDGGMAPGGPQGPQHGTGSIVRFEDVTLQIWAHIYLADYEGNITDDHGVQAEYMVAGGSELKMDIEIGNFPFSTETSSVTLETILQERLAVGEQNRERHRFETRERLRNNTFNSSMNWTTTEGNESRFENREGTDVQQIDFVDSVNDVTQGFFSWVDTAVVTLPGGAEEAVNVTASYVPFGEGLAVYLAYPNFNGGSLLHDPSIGLIEDSAPDIPIPIPLPVIAGLGIVVLVVIVVVAIRKR
jgi:hypothetical protein